MGDSAHSPMSVACKFKGKVHDVSAAGAIPAVFHQLQSKYSSEQLEKAKLHVNIGAAPDMMGCCDAPPSLPHWLFDIPYLLAALGLQGFKEVLVSGVNSNRDAVGLDYIL